MADEVLSDVSLTLKAVSLSYDEMARGMPTISATGRGHVAARLIELAKEYGIEIREDADLVEILSVMQQGDEIPVEAIHAVAQLLAWVYKQRDVATTLSPDTGSTAPSSQDTRA